MSSRMAFLGKKRASNMPNDSFNPPPISHKHIPNKIMNVSKPNLAY